MTTDSSQHFDLNDIQGNLVGFNKDHERLLFVNFADPQSGRAFLADLRPFIATASEVKRFNELYKAIAIRRGQVRGTVQSTWVNIALSRPGLEAIGTPELDAFPTSFRDGMAARANTIGDNGASSPANWIAPFTNGQRVHAVIILAADALDDLEDGTTWVRAVMANHNVIEAGSQDGHVRENANRGHEHFGFKDGISQPFIDGLTAAPNRKGSDVVAPGEILIGYPDEDGQISGQPAPQPPPGQPGYNPTPPPPQPALPPWAKSGSFLVYRRLQQNVGGFSQFTEAQAGPLGLPQDAVGAKLVGRWPSGAPLERVAGEHTDRDPASGDPASTTPLLLNPAKINNFTYQETDGDGHLVPRAAHIRKTNPRDENPPEPGVARHHRILRRGIPYGDDFVPGEAQYPTAGPVPNNQDRGLLFKCYQSSLEDGFEFVQQPWANTSDFPQGGDGQDPIISQNSDPRTASIPPHGALSMPIWVTTTGGDYFFAPALSALDTLAEG